MSKPLSNYRKNNIILLYTKEDNKLWTVVAFGQKTDLKFYNIDNDVYDFKVHKTLLYKLL